MSHRRGSTNDEGGASTAFGVKINILITAGMVDDSVQDYLKNRPNINVHDTTRGVYTNGYARYYTHDKYMMVSGSYAGTADSRLVFVGSSNWTSNGVWHNDETDLKLIGQSSYDAFMILVNAIGRAGSTNPKAIVTALKDTKDYNGLTGKLSKFVKGEREAGAVPDREGRRLPASRRGGPPEIITPPVN